MTYRFTDCEIDEPSRQLLRGGEPVHVERQVFDVIVYLIKNRDRVVSKDDLIENICRGRIVSDASVSSRIKAARKAIGDDGRAQAMISTVSRVGYRFVASLTGDGSGDHDGVAAEPGAPGSSRHATIDVIEESRFAKDLDQSAPAASKVVYPQRFAAGDRAMPKGLVGRVEELGRLEALLALARSGRGRSIVVSGEAGAGKTALVEAFLARLPGDARVFWTACEDLSIAEPLGPLIELAAPAGWTFDAEAVARGARLHLFGEALEALCDDDATTVLVVEDIHWADEATLDFLRYVARRIGSRRLLMLLTARMTDATSRKLVRSAFTGVPPDTVERLALRPLSVEAISELSGRDSAALFARTGGNAFFVTELLRTGAEEIPESVEDAVLAQADRLDAEARAVLDCVSIFPRRAELDLVTGLEGDGSASAIDDCLQSGLLELQDNMLHFRHEIAREAVEQTLPALQRTALHRKALDLLGERPGASPARLLHHARVAGDDEVICRLAPEAARAALQARANRQAAEFFDLAIGVAVDLDAGDRAALLEDAAIACHRINRLDAGVTLLSEALGLREDMGDAPGAAEDLHRISRLHWEIGNKLLARDFGDRAIARVAGTECRELAWAYANRAQIAMTDYDEDLTREMGAKAVALARKFGWMDILSHALTWIAMADLYRDGKAAPLLLENIKLAEQHGLPFHATRAKYNLARHLVETLHYADALTLFDEVLASSHELEQIGHLAFCRGSRCECLAWMGRWDEALAEARAMLSKDEPQVVARFFSRFVLAIILSRRGDPEAERWATELARVLRGGEEIRFVGHFAWLLAERAWLGLGDRDEARRWIARTLAMARDPATIQPILMWRSLLEGGPNPVPEDGLFEPYRLFLSGQMHAAAEAWHRVGDPYKEALALMQAGPEAERKALAIFDRLGAAAPAAMLRSRQRPEGRAG